RHPSAGCAGKLLENGRDGAARAAPLCPEVHHHEALIRDERLVEALFRKVDRSSISHERVLLVEKSTATLTYRTQARNFLPCQFDTPSCQLVIYDGGNRSRPDRRRRELDPAAPQGSPHGVGLSSVHGEHRDRRACRRAHPG